MAINNKTLLTRPYRTGGGDRVRHRQPIPKYIWLANRPPQSMDTERWNSLFERPFPTPPTLPHGNLEAITEITTEPYAVCLFGDSTPHAAMFDGVPYVPVWSTLWEAQSHHLDFNLNIINRKSLEMAATRLQQDPTMGTYFELRMDAYEGISAPISVIECVQTPPIPCYIEITYESQWSRVSFPPNPKRYPIVEGLTIPFVPLQTKLGKYYYRDHREPLWAESLRSENPFQYANYYAEFTQEEIQRDNPLPLAHPEVFAYSVSIGINYALIDGRYRMED